MASFEAAVSPFNPEAGNVLCGALGNTATTLITIPAGRTWVGSITINATAQGTAALAFAPNVVTPNTAGVYPQNAIVAICNVATAAVAGGNAAANSATFPNVIVKNTTGSSINLTSVLTGAGTTTNASFVANGVLL